MRFLLLCLCCCCCCFISSNFVFTPSIKTVNLEPVTFPFSSSSISVIESKIVFGIFICKFPPSGDVTCIDRAFIFTV